MSKREIKFKNKIKKYRENRGITMKQFADGIGEKYITVHQMEKRKSFPRGNTRKKIMEFLGASFDEIFYERQKGEEL